MKELQRAVGFRQYADEAWTLAHASSYAALSDHLAELLPSGLSPERQASFLLDVARAHAQRRHVGEAAAALLEAESLAPEQIHDHHLAREVIRELTQLSGRRIPESLRALAERSAVA